MRIQFVGFLLVLCLTLWASSCKKENTNTPDKQEQNTDTIPCSDCTFLTCAKKYSGKYFFYKIKDDSGSPAHPVQVSFFNADSLKYYSSTLLFNPLLSSDSVRVYRTSDGNPFSAYLYINKFNLDAVCTWTTYMGIYNPIFTTHTFYGTLLCQ